MPSSPWWGGGARSAQDLGLGLADRGAPPPLQARATPDLSDQAWRVEVTCEDTLAGAPRPVLLGRFKRAVTGSLVWTRVH